MKTIFFIPFFMLISAVYAQFGFITGNISDRFSSLSDATVLLEGTSFGAITNADGYFAFEVDTGSYTLIVSKSGYTTELQKVVVTDLKTVNLDIHLKATLMNEEVGSGSTTPLKQKQMESPVPIDVITSKDIQDYNQQNLGQLLHYMVPTFYSTRQTIADGSDHVDPISLRGLSSEHVLVLIDGKRRHSNAMIHVNGTFGRGSSGVDLNAIPVAAIERIEILRDGAAAIYGSDAIAGVINIILKKKTGVATLKTMAGNTYKNDGASQAFSGNYGFALGKTGFLNVTGSFVNISPINRAGNYTGDIFGDERDDNPDDKAAFYDNNESGLDDQKVMEIGQAHTRNANIFFNTAVEIKKGMEIYGNGGLNYRKGVAKGFYRFPKDSLKVVEEFYSYGFSPEMHTDISDKSLVLGVKGIINEKWNIDFSNNSGSNAFDFTVKNSNNASLGTASPISAYAGGFRYGQNIISLDVTRSFKKSFFPINLSFGSRFRIENYEIVAGETNSYFNGNDTSYAGDAKIAGMQLFPGFQPENEIIKLRSNATSYIDVDLAPTKQLLMNLASRFESYSDFGTNFSWKVASRYKFGKGLVIRAAYNTGFKAPSLHQIYYNKVSTITSNSDASELLQVATFNNESSVSKSFGFESLKPELSNSYSFGLTSRPSKNLSITMDYYNINIKDRIVLTSIISVDEDSANFSPILDPFNISEAQFFTNAVDSKTYGIDIFSVYTLNTDKIIYNLHLGYNYNYTEVSRLPFSSDLLEGKEDIIFDRGEVSRLKDATPRSKTVIKLTAQTNKFNIALINSRFGEIKYVDAETEEKDEVFGAKWVTDLSVSYKLNNNISFTVGANNLFDVYPDKNKNLDNTASGSFVYSRRVQQFGIMGGYYFGKVIMKL